MVDMVTWQPGGETARTFDLMGSAGIQGALFAIKSSLLILDFSCSFLFLFLMSRGVGTWSCDLMDFILEPSRTF